MIDQRLEIMSHAGIAQLVERNLAKVEVASSRLVSRSKFLDTTTAATVVLFLSAGAMAEWLCSGLQIRLGRFDSGLRLQVSFAPIPLSASQPQDIA